MTGRRLRRSARERSHYHAGSMGLRWGSLAPWELGARTASANGDGNGDGRVILEQLWAAAEKRPQSIRKLAALLGREPRAVTEDLDYLASVGLVKFRSRRGYRNARIPVVPYDRVDLSFELRSRAACRPRRRRGSASMLRRSPRSWRGDGDRT